MFEKIESLLKEHSLNLKQLAKEVNIPYTTLASWKSRKSGIKIDNLRKIADYFKVPLDYFSDKNLSINNYVIVTRQNTCLQPIK